MLLGYVCKSVRASDGTRGPTVGLRPSGSPTPLKDVYSWPPPQRARETSPPRPAGTCELSEGRELGAACVGHVRVPASVCVSVLPASSGRQPVPGPRPGRGLSSPRGAVAVGGCCCRWPVSLSLPGGWQGGQIFNVLYRVFLCNHPHFYLLTDLSWLFFLNSALVENKGNGPWPAWGVVCDAFSELCAPSRWGSAGEGPTASPL